METKDKIYRGTCVETKKNFIGILVQIERHIHDQWDEKKQEYINPNKWYIVDFEYKDSPLWEMIKNGVLVDFYSLNVCTPIQTIDNKPVFSGDIVEFENNEYRVCVNPMSLGDPIESSFHIFPLKEGAPLIYSTNDIENCKLKGKKDE